MQQLFRQALPIWRYGWPLKRINQPMKIIIHGIENSLAFLCNWNLNPNTQQKSKKPTYPHTRVCWPSHHSTIVSRQINAKINKRSIDTIIEQLQPTSEKINPSTLHGHHALKYNNQWLISMASIDKVHTNHFNRHIESNKIDILDLDYFCMWRLLHIYQQLIELPAWLLAIDQHHSQLFCYDPQRWGIVYHETHDSHEPSDGLIKLQRQANLPKLSNHFYCIKPKDCSLDDTQIRQLLQIPIQYIKPHQLWQSEDPTIQKWQQQYPVLMSLALGMYYWGKTSGK